MNLDLRGQRVSSNQGGVAMVDLVALSLLYPLATYYCVGDQIPIQVRATTPIPVRASSADLIIRWDPAVLRLDGLDPSTTTTPFTYLDFPGPKSLLHDFSGINETIPPADGDALIYWLSLLGTPVFWDDDIIVTLNFTVIAPYTSTTISFIPALTYTGYPQETVLYGSMVPGTDVTGTLTNALLLCNPFDLNSDTKIDSFDLAILLNNWDTSSPAILAGILNYWSP